MYSSVLRVATCALLAASLLGAAGCKSASDLRETESYSTEGIQSTVEIGHDHTIVRSSLTNRTLTNVNLDELLSRMQSASRATGFGEIEVFSAGTPSSSTEGAVKVTKVVHHVILRNPRDQHLTPMLFRLEGKIEQPPDDTPLEEGWLDEKSYEGPRVTFNLVGPLAIYNDFQRGTSSARLLEKHQSMEFQLARKVLLAKFSVKSLGFEEALGTSLRSMYGIAAPRPSQREAIKAVARALRRINEEAIR
jgi:hypothetical protein